MSNTLLRIAAVGSLLTEPMTAVGLRWLVPEAGLALFASGVWALRPFGVAIVCAPNGTLAEIDDVLA